MTIAGTFVDAQTGKPIQGITVDFYPDGDRSKDPYATFNSDANGNFSFTNGLLDTETNAMLDAYATGYNEQFGPVAAFNGNVPMTEVTEQTGGISFVNILVILVILGLIVWYFKLYKHL